MPLAFFMKFMYFLFLISCSLIILVSCSLPKQLSKQADAVLLNDSSVKTGFIGISIYEPATHKYWYNYNATKNFTPASNTKLFALFAGMKYLGDSLPGIQYFISDPNSADVNSKILFLKGTGDPSLLSSDFKIHPVFELLKNSSYNAICGIESNWKENALGYGWAWDDYNDDYMAERSPIPIFGNTLQISLSKAYELIKPHPFKVIPADFEPVINGAFELFVLNTGETRNNSNSMRVKFIRNRNGNQFTVQRQNNVFSSAAIPFVTNGSNMAIDLLADTYKKVVFKFIESVKDSFSYYYVQCPGCIEQQVYRKPWKTIHSQPTDSLFKPMMYRSDNFYAEQTLLMASNVRLGYMNDKEIIDTLLQTDLKDIPQRPKWVDGSGLSRYNLFTPQAFIYILNKLKNEFGWDRIKHILPTGNEGTLKSFYKKDSGYIYAKTGTLSNNCSLSGYLITNKGKILIFSILANHYQTAATPIRQAVERFLSRIREKY